MTSTTTHGLDTTRRTRGPEAFCTCGRRFSSRGDRLQRHAAEANAAQPTDAQV